MRMLYAGKKHRRDQIFPLQRLSRFNTPAAQVRQFDPNFDYFESFSDLKLT